MCAADSPFYLLTPKDMYRRIYYEALDLLVQTIQARFDQPGYKMYGCIEALLLKARFHKRDYSEDLKQVLEVYSTNLSESICSLKIHLSIFSSNVFNYDKIGNIFDIINTYNSLLERKGSL